MLCLSVLSAAFICLQKANKMTGAKKKSAQLSFSRWLSLCDSVDSILICSNDGSPDAEKTTSFGGEGSTNVAAMSSKKDQARSVTCQH